MKTLGPAFVPEDPISNVPWQPNGIVWNIHKRLNPMLRLSGKTKTCFYCHSVGKIHILVHCDVIIIIIDASSTSLPPPHFSSSPVIYVTKCWRTKQLRQKHQIQNSYTRKRLLYKLVKYAPSGKCIQISYGLAVEFLMSSAGHFQCSTMPSHDLWKVVRAFENVKSSKNRSS